MMLQIRDAASYLGVCNKTLRRWESRGYILPQRTQGYHRRYDSDALIQFQKTGIYEVNSAPKLISERFMPEFQAKNRKKILPANGIS